MLAMRKKCFLFFLVTKKDMGDQTRTEMPRGVCRRARRPGGCCADTGKRVMVLPSPRSEMAARTLSGCGWAPSRPSSEHPYSGMLSAGWAGVCHWIRWGTRPPPGRDPSRVKAKRQRRLSRRMGRTCAGCP